MKSDSWVKSELVQFMIHSQVHLNTVYSNNCISSLWVSRPTETSYMCVYFSNSTWGTVIWVSSAECLIFSSGAIQHFNFVNLFLKGRERKGCIASVLTRYNKDIPCVCLNANQVAHNESLSLGCNKHFKRAPNPGYCSVSSTKIAAYFVPTPATL